MKIYYAHAMSWYNTKAEDQDVTALRAHGAVENPNSAFWNGRVRYYKQAGLPVMDMFASYIKNDADVVAFRRLNSGKITAGVAREILEAVIWGKPVWEIYSDVAHGGPFINKDVLGTIGQFDLAPAISLNDFLTVAQTKAIIDKGEL